MANSVITMQAARNKIFQDRVKFFMQKAALAILAESLSTAGHTERIAYSATVLDGIASVFDYASAVVTNSTILAAISTDFANAIDPTIVTDSDIEFTVNSMVNAFSGYESGGA